MSDALRLTVRDLRCVRGERAVFAGLTFEVQAGDALAVTGPNGAGKSSLLRILAGLLASLEGEIALNGGANDAGLAEQAHYLGHKDAIKPSLSVAENLRFWVQFLGRNGGEEAEPGLLSSLATVGLDQVADLPASYLSAGQRRRLSIARLVAIPRPVWLLDEPLTALDTVFQARLADLMRLHLGGGGLIVAATHAPLGLSAAELRLGSTAPANPSTND